MRYSILVTLLFFLLFPSSIYSQVAERLDAVALALPEDTAMTGETIYMPVTVENFTGIIAMQFSISYDSLVLEFQDVSDFGLEYLTIDNFGLPPGLPKGVLTVSWFDQQLQPQSLEDGDTLFVLRFEVIGGPGSWSALAFTGTPADVEFGDENGLPLPYILDSGSVYVEPGVAARSLKNPEFTYFPLSPNPMSAGLSYLRFELHKAMDVHWRVMNAEGKILIEGSDYLPPGQHSILLQKEQLPSAGTYIVELSGENYRGARTLIVTH